MGCADARGAVIISSKIRSENKPNPLYLPIEFDLNSNKINNKNHLFDYIDLNYCQKYSICFFFNNNEYNKIFNKVFDDKIEKYYKKFNKIFKYEKFFDNINKMTYEEIENFLNTNIINNINDYNFDDELLKKLLLYCNNNLIRIILYSIKLKQIPFNENFSLIHINKNTIIEKENKNNNNLNEVDDNDKKIKNNDKDNYIIKNLKIIETDEFRTFPNLEINYEKEYSKNYLSILQEFIIRNNYIGYYQGFNFFCGFILILFGNNLDFSFYYFLKIFSLKSKKFNLPFTEIYNNEFKLLKIYLEEFNLNLIKFFPEIYNNIKKIDIIEYCWVGKWIQLLFLTNFDYDLILKFWDIILAIGLDYIIGISLAIVEILKDKLIECKDLVDFNNVINNGKVELNDNEKKNLYKIIYSDIKNNKYKLI